MQKNFDKFDFAEIGALRQRLTGFQFEFFQAVYQEDISLFVDLGGMEQDLDFDIDDNGANLFHLAVFRCRYVLKFAIFSSTHCFFFFKSFRLFCIAARLFKAGIQLTQN